MTKIRITLTISLIVTIAVCISYKYYTEYNMNIGARAESGEVNAMFEKGASLYATGKITEAVIWLTKAAEAGDSRAQVRVAYMFANGVQREKDDKEALKWLLKSAEQGNLIAQVSTGAFYYTGRGGVEDHHKAAYWYEKAADQSSKPAIQKLIGLYSTGDTADASKLQQTKARFDKTVETRKQQSCN